VLKMLDRLEEILIGTLIAVATIIIFIAVCHRYGLTMAIDLFRWAQGNEIAWLATGSRAVFDFLRDINLTWAQELCIYLFVWMAKFGAAYGVRTGIHVGVDIAINQLNPASRYRVVLFGLLCGALFTFIVGTLGARFVYHIAETGQISADLEAPMWLVYLAVPLGSYLMCFRFLQVAWAFARTGDLPHHDHGYVEGIEDDVPLVPGLAGSGDREPRTGGAA
jgi:TRAP-type C4-dicarboxylate transport system permease small subunit